ncbi:MAG: DUF616 domain-containing protein [Microbacterium sp.]|uniref:glycosyltransferase domain-containing protein n=1 Tax=Microbacterium sp. TaxID=51671 RepID=UPI0019ABBE54|nr:glycosyltransferase domain-containing protein [Microbacterium sp.]MBD3757442.1 DUF616 domain-containing protein [Microbacterium sp.]
MKVCVYTVLLGGYDVLLDQPVAIDSAADFVCFSDDDGLVSDTWRVEAVVPYLPQDLHRSSRVLKILGHPLLSQYDVTICIDASVLLRATPEQIIADLLTDDVDMALAEHSHREMILDEFDEVVRLNYDDAFRVYEQLSDYAAYFPEALTAKPLWGGLLVRRNTPAVAAAMRVWFDQVLRYSRRDQLSLPLALMLGAVRYRAVALDNFSSALHEWPVITGRRVVNGKARLHSSAPLLVEFRRAERRIHDLEDQVASAEPTAASLRQSIASLEAEVATTAGERTEVERELGAVRAQLSGAERLIAHQRSVRGALRNLVGAVGRRLSRSN